MTAAERSMDIQGATILAMGSARGRRPFTGDLVIDGNVIAGTGPDLTSPGNAEVIGGGGLLLIPGLVNARAHSCETFFRGLNIPRPNTAVRRRRIQIRQLDRGRRDTGTRSAGQTQRPQHDKKILLRPLRLNWKEVLLAD